MLHLTAAEQSIISNRLLDCIKYISEDVSREYIIDLEIDKDIVISIDCQKHEASVNFKGVVFDIKKSGRELTLVSAKSDVTTEEYDLMLLFKKYGKDKLREQFLVELAKRDEVHSNIVDSEELAMQEQAKKAAKAAAKEAAVNIIDDNFNKQYNAVKDALGFTTKHTVVKMDAQGTITLYQDKEKHRIRLEEVVKCFSGGETITHSFNYDTLLKHKSYKVNNKQVDVDQVYVSLDCSVDYKKAIDVVVGTLDAMIDDVDASVQEQLNDLFEENEVLSESSEFNGFKKTTIE